MTADPLLVELDGVDYRVGGRTVMRDIHFTLRQGENWLVLGANGSGKSTLMALVRGDLWPAQGKGARRFYIEGQVRTSPIGWRERTGLVSNEIIDRYMRIGRSTTALEAVLGGLMGGLYPTRAASQKEREQAVRALGRMGVDGLAERDVLTLSRGEFKKVLVARALAGEPEVLFLDESCEGLDPQARRDLLESIEALASSGVQIVYATHDPGETIPSMNRALQLENGRIACQGDVGEVLGGLEEGAACPLEMPGREAPKPGGRELVRIRNVDVYLDRTRILEDISWTMRRGENWCVAGPNGSGKTTLLRLVHGDVVPALGGEVVRFGDPDMKRVADIRLRIGLVSPRLQSAHEYSETGLGVVLSGFFGSIGLYDKPSRRQKERARTWMSFLGIGHLEKRDAQAMSYGQFRRCLVARAMVNEPELLLLDEPCGGLDSDSCRRVQAVIERLARLGVNYVYVTHRFDEQAARASHLLVMEKGRIVWQGPRDEAGDALLERIGAADQASETTS
jgi:molybdate transport system ATP-binding protein